MYYFGGVRRSLTCVARLPVTLCGKRADTVSVERLPTSTANSIDRLVMTPLGSG
jgi:hypothetical protein